MVSIETKTKWHHVTLYSHDPAPPRQKNLQTKSVWWHTTFSAWGPFGSPICTLEYLASYVTRCNIDTKWVALSCGGGGCDSVWVIWVYWEPPASPVTGGGGGGGEGVLDQLFRLLRLISGCCSSTSWFSSCLLPAFRSGFITSAHCEGVLLATRPRLHLLWAQRCCF